MTVGTMAANVLAYFAEGENRVISRRMARGQASAGGAAGGGGGAGGGSRNAGLVIPVSGPEGWVLGIPSRQRPIPDTALLHDLSETKGVRCLASECLKPLIP